MKTLPVVNARWEVLPPYMTPAKHGEPQIETNVFPIGYACELYAEGEHAGKVAAYRTPIDYTGDKSRAEAAAKALNGYEAAIDALTYAASITAQQYAAPDSLHALAERNPAVRAWIANERGIALTVQAKAHAALAVYDGETPPSPTPPTPTDLENLAALHGVRVVPDLRAGCFNLYWPDGGNVFAVSVRDAIREIEFNAATR